MAYNSVESLLLGKYLGDRDNQGTHLKPLIFLTQTLSDFSCEIQFKDLIYPLKYIVGRDSIDLRANQVRDNMCLCTGFRQDFLPRVLVDTKWIYMARPHRVNGQTVEDRHQKN